MKFDKQKVMKVLPFIILGYFFNKVSQAFTSAAGTELGDKIMNGMDGLGEVFLNPLPSFNPIDLLIGVAGGVIVKLVIYVKGKNAKKYRKGCEYGSARWGNAEDIKPYMADKFEDNVILTETERLTMDGRPKAGPKYARNKNILVIGGSGSGKTRFYVKPNLLQMHSSYVVTDPKGTVLNEVGKALQDGGYAIKVLNTINFKKSMHYNPLAYIRSEKDILKLVNTIIANTKGEGSQSGEDFWVKAERLYYSALIGYIWYEAPKEEKNLNTLIEMINASEAREDDETFENPIDLLFKELEQKNPEHFAVRQYKKYKLAAGKTAKSILISCGARLAPFDIAELRELTEDDELELDTLGDKKTALFVIISDTDDTFNFIVAIMYTQLFNLLCDKADDKYGGRLPVHVRFILDEFANIGQIPKFDKLIATIRSREISASIILQAQSQLKAIYKDNADTIVGNCDTTLFLGGKEKTTLKEISEILGKETIDLYNTGESRGKETSHSLNYQKTGKELMSMDELSVMDGSKCILQLRGVRPFLSNNENKEVEVYRYMTEATFDAYLYQTIENKQRFISQIMSSKSPVRSCEDVDEATLSYAEVKALCAGNPLIKEKMDLDVAVTKLKVSKANHTSQQYTIEDSVRKHFPERIAKTEQRIAGLEADLAHFKAQPDVTEGISPMTILNKTFTDKEEAGKALLLACKQIKSKENLEIGSYKGFDMSLSYDSFAQEFHLELQREMSYTVTLGTSESGNILRIDNALDSIEKRIENSKEQLETLNEQLSTAKAELGKPFPQEAELTEKLARLAELNTLLNIDENAIENAAVAAEKKPDIPISADEVKPMRNVFPERKTSILDRIKEMQSAQAGNIPKEKTPTKDKTSEIS